MSSNDKISHWENVYNTKSVNEVSWYQPTPVTSLNLIAATESSLSDSIIDIGGGDSFLVDHLLKKGYTDITVLDISAKAIERAKERLGENAEKVKWIVADASKFEPVRRYDIWHDRAAFHFLNTDEQVAGYMNGVEMGISEKGQLIVGAFSEKGPLKCSGLEIRQYSQDALESQFSEKFQKVDGFNVDHRTPFDTIQNFTFCRFVLKPA
jgi:SAM-dependent methyltransferase